MFFCPGIYAAEIQICLIIQNNHMSLATELQSIVCASHRVNVVHSSDIVRINANMDGFHVATERFQTEEDSHQFEAVNVVLRFCLGPSASYFFSTHDSTPTFAWGISIQGDFDFGTRSTKRLISLLNIITPPL